MQNAILCLHRKEGKYTVEENQMLGNLSVLQATICCCYRTFTTVACSESPHSPRKSHKVKQSCISGCGRTQDQQRLQVQKKKDYPPSNITTEKRKAVTTLDKDNSISILLADKGRCTVVLNQPDCHCKITTWLRDDNTY